MLHSVVRALSLDAAEKAHLYRLADVPTAHAGTALMGAVAGVVSSARYDGDH
ncbi:hypothetical protein AB0M12_12055 [Nocardia vinacea]|uniref:hypothetical protein n=1 Tax=Nocardia vinacea TaxID=96468 RepID=UPI00344283F5